MAHSSASSHQSISPSPVDSPNLSTPATTCDDAEIFSSSSSVIPKHAFPLTEYIPVGCLLGSPTSKIDRSEWEEIHQINFISPFLALAESEPLLAKLLEAEWIRILAGSPSGFIVLRIHVLPDDLGHSAIDRSSKSLRLALARLIESLDVSEKTWKGRPGESCKFDLWASGVNHSLFWLFNTLPSPSPVPFRIQDRFSRLPAEELLEADPCIPGLTAKLFRYQARSVAAMIEREAAPQQNVDPRFEPRTTPKGQNYYYSPRDMLFRQRPVYYECNRGGILAETMGYGKTVICLALILATKYHLYVHNSFLSAFSLINSRLLVHAYLRSIQEVPN
jgi:hypothetical protein